MNQELRSFKIVFFNSLFLLHDSVLNLMAQPIKIKKQIKRYQITLKKVTKKVLAKKIKSVKVIKKTAKKIKKIEIKPNMIISKVIEKYPEGMRVFYDYSITCVGCFLASSETIEQGISAHGIDVKKFISDLEKELNK